MPWVSAKEQRWGHSKAGLKALGGPAKVSEWDAATDFSNLPEKTPKKNTMGMKKPPKIAKAT